MFIISFSRFIHSGDMKKYSDCINRILWLEKIGYWTKRNGKKK